MIVCRAMFFSAILFFIYLLGSFSPNTTQPVSQSGVAQRFVCRFCFLTAVVLGLGLNSFSASAANPIQSTEQVHAELLAFTPDGVVPGRPMWLGLWLQHQPQWHTYWKNPGDSGLPTELQWTLPQGVSVGDIIWPAPHKLPVADLINYGYDGEILLVIPLHVAPDYKPEFLSNTLPVAAQVRWLVCRQECIPQSVALSLDIPLNSSTALYAGRFQTVLDHIPATLPTVAIARVEGNTLTLQSNALPSAWLGETLEVFPQNPSVFSAAAPIVQHWNQTTWQAQISLAAIRQSAPETLSFLLQAPTLQPAAVVLPSKVQGAWPATQHDEPVLPALQAALDTQTASAKAIAPRQTGITTQANGLSTTNLSVTLWWAFLGALAGGLLLNLMPCVFPILAIKVMAFMQAHESPQQRRAHGLLYGLGVVLSCLLLGGLLVGLRSAGQAMGWGFQLQSPWMVGFLTVLFILLGLNLLGLFEFKVYLPSRLANARARTPTLDHFLSGILAVVVATPCTAPFMGAALGAVIVLAWPQALLVFAALGLGLALPYVVLAFVPAPGRLLPRPGAWMVTFRKIMAVPMLLSALWLGWVGWQQIGAPPASTGKEMRAGLNTLANITYGAWKKWSPALQQALQNDNKNVFVDYTAAWCITCQINKRTTLSDTDVMAAFARQRVFLLQADWTNHDPEVTASLHALGRLGIPVYTLQKGNGSMQVFSEILYKDELLEALSALPQP